MKKWKLDRYYKNNYLYRSHTMMLTEMHEKTIYTCRDCQFFIKIIGRQETKTACVISIPVYKKRIKIPPPEVNIYEILKHISAEKLMQLVENSFPYKTACPKFMVKKRKV
ncbi:MAG: hypothetical protein H0Z40_01620 [Desulfotomaculum sp.]|nr:hypothetical protein [Desulfotomaculum sp.]